MAGGRKLTPDEHKDRRQKADVEWLLKQPAFKRFLMRVIQEAGLFTATTDGSQDAAAKLARRNLGLAILEMVELGQPAAHPNGMPILTLIQTLLEEANPPPSERDDEERTIDEQRYDRTAELDDADDDEPSSERR